MGILQDIDKNIAAERRLKRIAKGEDVTLSADDAARILKHIEWLSNQRESLLNSRHFDDD